MNHKTLSLTVAASSLIAGSATADYTGLSFEGAEYTGEIEALAGTWTARIYVNFDAETDILDAVFGVPQDPLLITSTNGFYQHPFGGCTATSINPAFYDMFPSLLFDSWVTIDLEDQIGNDMLPDFDCDVFGAGGDISTDNGGWSTTTGGPAGKDLRVLIGQFTMYGTDSHVSGVLNLQGKVGNFETFQALDQAFYYVIGCEDTTTDCNANKSNDYCDITNGISQDCNGNWIPDECDVVNGNSYDCDQNGVPDECQPDCDGDGWIDPCDAEGDCDGDDIPDNCELDCNENGVPDDCDIIFGISQDCNENGVPDECDIAEGAEEDCNENGVPDSCDLADDPSLDCDGDGVFDSCAINDGLVEDCNGNNIPDSCDITDGTEEDCNVNNVPDSCEINYLFQPVDKLLASDGYAHDEFGKTVSVDGNTALIGMPGDFTQSAEVGAVYVYRLDGYAWVQESKLVASDGFPEDRFGKSLALDGDTALITSNLGVYVFRYDGSEWVEETKLNPSMNFTIYGEVSISGDVAVLYASVWEDAVLRSSQFVFVYRYRSGVWMEEATISPSPDFYSGGVAVSGNTLVIGSSGDDEFGANTGVVYVYRFSGSSWIQEAKLYSDDPSSNDYFGSSVAVDGDTIIVGATGYWSGCSDTGGEGHFFHFNGKAWTKEAEFCSGDVFGYSVSVDGNLAAISAPGDGDDYPGSVVIYRRANGTWAAIASYGQPAWHEFFGCSVSISEGNLLVGAQEGGSSEAWHGAVYTFKELAESDCNFNGVPDECDIEDGTSDDVNSNGIPDECEVDCNGNGVPDHWDIKTGTSEDCNSNEIPDECDIEDGTSSDVNSNGVPDECEVDCNANGYPDDYDIQMGWSDDVNGDGIPDECQCIADTNDDGFVDINDILLVVGYWGLAIDSGDINNDGIIDVIDLILLIANWGPCE